MHRLRALFPAGVLVVDEKKHVSVLKDLPGMFLGFEVADIDVIRFESSGDSPAAGQRAERVAAKTGRAVRRA